METTYGNMHEIGAHQFGDMKWLAMIFIVIILISAWKVFTKAGRQGWEALIPIYNVYVVTKITGQPWWMLLLCLIPFLGLAVLAYLSFKLAERFGQGIAFAIGLVLLPFLFFPILAFGQYKYIPPPTTDL